MTIFRNKSGKKRTSIQCKAIHSIALAGHISITNVAKEIESYYANVYEAFKALGDDHVIEFSYKNFDSPRGEIYYKLTGQGLYEFIEQGLSPEEFWIAMTWFCELCKVQMSKDEFENYYRLFAQKYTGSSSFDGCFFQTEFFNRLFEKWERDSKYENQEFAPPQRVFHNLPWEEDNSPMSQKVLECLAWKRSITIGEISKIIKIPQENVSNLLKNYTLTPEDLINYHRRYKTIPNTSDEIEKVSVDYFYHLIIVSKQKNERVLYELSLIGVLILLKLIAIRRQRATEYTFTEYYDAIASNYTEKLPLIFGKWDLLKTTRLDLSDFPSIIDYILLDKSQVLSLSILLGGNKEIYDNMRSVMFERIYKFSEIYDKAENALPDWYSKKFKENKNLRLIQEKINEIGTLLKYADLKSFGEYMRKSQFINTVDDFNYEEELRIIENRLAEEFTMLFYIGLIRENKYVASDYPLSTVFISSHPDLLYPKDILISILAQDAEIRNKMKKWITETIDYQKNALRKMEVMLKEISWYK